jgi:hypothetical protein
MWVFDGEKWTEEGTSSHTEQNQKTVDPREYPAFYPELQIVEVPHIERREVHIPILIP